jgi:hypothetical protein
MIQTTNDDASSEATPFTRLQQWRLFNVLAPRRDPACVTPRHRWPAGGVHGARQMGAMSPAFREDEIDSFVFCDGMIGVQMVSATP